MTFIQSFPLSEKHFKVPRVIIGVAFLACTEGGGGGGQWVAVTRFGDFRKECLRSIYKGGKNIVYIFKLVFFQIIFLKTVLRR